MKREHKPKLRLCRQCGNELKTAATDGISAYFCELICAAQAGY